MTEKIEIVEQLGEQGILLPGLLGKALQANDRIKLRFSLLQEAIAQTRNPRQNPPTFTTERHAAGLDDTLFDATISGARTLTGNLVPGSKELLSGLRTDLAAMLTPIETADPASAQSFSNRLTALSKSISISDGDTISSGDIPPMTSARRETSDSVHLLVMDMHQAINRLAAATAPETIDGAKVHCAEPETDQSLRERRQSHQSSCVRASRPWHDRRAQVGKALQTFGGRNGAISLLTWAAAHEHGHRGFLELGGVDLVFEAIRRVAEGRIPYGARLDNALGMAETEDFLRYVLQQTSRGLLAGRSARLTRDESETTLFMIVLRHLGLSRMLAGRLSDTLSMGGMAPAEDRRRIALHAQKLEEKADRLTLLARELAVRLHDSGKLRRLVDAVEDAIDTLDECALLLSLVPETEAANPLATPMAGLARLAVESVSSLVRAVEAAAQLPLGLRADARRCASLMSS